MEPRDPERTAGAMRLILSGEAAYLAADGRLILVNGPDRLALLIERVLVVSAPDGTAPRVPVETLRALTRTADKLTAEATGPRSGGPINVPLPDAPTLVTLLEGHYRDRWTADAFGVEVVNTSSEPCEVTLDLFLPRLEDEDDAVKPMTVQTDTASFDIDVQRGGLTPVTLSVEQRLTALFRTTPEPSQGPDTRSRGVLVAAIRGSSGQVEDVFPLSTYFD